MELEGRITFSLLPPEWDAATFAYWWLPEVDERGCIVRESRMNRVEKERYHAYETTNLITLLGRQQLLTDIGQGISATNFTQYLGIGTGPIVSVSPGDTSIPTEIIRVGNNGYYVDLVNSGTHINFFLTAAQGNAAYSSVGIWGGGASGTPGGAGTLYSHALSSFTKTSSNALSIDYGVFIV